MKKKIFFMVFMCFWIILVILNFIIPSKSFSENENRMLASIPKFDIEDLFNGEYIDKLDEYINDHFVFRDAWLKIKSTSELLLGKTENNGVYIGKDGYLFEKIEYTDTGKQNIDKLVNTINKLQSDSYIFSIYSKFNIH